MADAEGKHLLSCALGHFLRQLRLKGGAEAQRGRKQVCSGKGGRAGQRLAVNQRGDGVFGVLDHILLSLHDILSHVLTAENGERTDAAIEILLLQRRDGNDHGAGDLLDLFRRAHAAHKVVYSFVDGKLGILIRIVCHVFALLKL